MLRERALNQLITREVLRQVAADAGVRLSAQQVASRIRQQEFFRQNGQFNRELYRQILERSGMTPEQYEAQMREAFRIEQLRGGLVSSSFALAQEARYAAQLQRQERRVAVLEHSRERAAEQVSVTDEDVQAYYEQHQDQFQTPPQVRLSYIELSPENLTGEVEVTEDELRAEYRQQQQGRQQAEERQAAHVLIEVADDASQEEIDAARQRAQELRQRLVDGEAEFSAIAREHSDDPGSASQGGDLGYVKRGTMVEAFEQALFSLDDAGAISEPVRTSYGFHLIKLEDVRGGGGDERSFADARADLEKRIRQRKAERLFRDRVELLRNAAYENPSSLGPAASATGLDVQRSDWFTRDDGEGIAQSEAVREAAFQPSVREQGVNSDLVELGNRRVAVVRVADRKPAQPKPLEEVRQQVREQVRQQRIDRIFEQWSQSVVTELEEGAGLSELAREATDYRELGWIDRNWQEEAAIASAAFELSPPRDDGPPAHRAVRLSSGNHAVLAVRDVRLPELEQSAVAQARTQLRRGIGGAEQDAWTQGLRAAADISRSQ
jgi:peptidyl-prolyl cis-trans isomerase D